MAQTVKNLPAMQETKLPSLDWEDPLEKGREIHSSILVWEIPRAERPDWTTVLGFAKNRTRLSDQHYHYAIKLLRTGLRREKGLGRGSRASKTLTELEE